MPAAEAAQGAPLASIFHNPSILAKAVAGLLLAGYLVSLADGLLAYLALVPGRTVPFAWNLVTYSFVTDSIVELISSLLGWLLLSKVVEPVYGAKGLLTFMLAVALATGMMTFVTAFIVYVATRSPHVLYRNLCGFHGVLAGLLVTLKQIMPDQELALFGVIKFRGRHLPGLYVLLTTVLGLLSDPLGVLPFVLYGTYFSWLYLRFFHRNPETNLRGDPSQDFRLASFFPEQVQPAVDKVAGMFPSPKLGAVQPRQLGHVLGGTSLTGGDDHDAARRRERGARALEERIKKQKDVDLENPGGHDAT
ncbi:unnamed protein product [Ostreobium quekettii]|uniref:Uncharacterized protein n=1 Tax=Ostreobium quekettii TaxID=121088 RepID=A0A8S1IN01_9CHLO|nr:unnamed protein product [Ostreobium quekettii]